MHQSLKYLKTSILAFSFLLSLIIYVFAQQTISTDTVQSIRLSQWFGLISLVFLFFALLAGPLYRVFPKVPYKSYYYGSLGGLGISAFYFGFLHSYVSFFDLLKGFNGISFLTQNYLIANLLGLIGLFILSLMAGTSFTYMMNLLGKKWWKRLHRFVYVAGIAILIHTVMLGTHYKDISGITSNITLIALLILIVLHSIAINRSTMITYPNLPRYIPVSITLIVLFILLSGLYFAHGLIHPH